MVELRVSQINGCAYCVNVHAEQARARGESDQRIDCLCVWDECGFFDEAEQAAFRWAEALTNVSHGHPRDDVYDTLTAHYSEEQIVALTLIVAAMNAWNRIAIGHHTLPAQRKTP